jgi:hypothetical protein
VTFVCGKFLQVGLGFCFEIKAKLREIETDRGMNDARNSGFKCKSAQDCARKEQLKVSRDGA